MIHRDELEHGHVSPALVVAARIHPIVMAFSYSQSQAAALRARQRDRLQLGMMGGLDPK